MRSTSSLVKDYLSTKPLGFTIANDELYNEIVIAFPDETVSRTGVSACTGKFANLGVLECVGKVKRILSYTIIGDIKSITVNEKKPEHAEGYTRNDVNGRRTRKFVTKESLRDQLFDIACKIEELRPDLSLYTNDELLKELMKRKKQ